MRHEVTHFQQTKSAVSEESFFIYQSKPVIADEVRLRGLGWIQGGEGGFAERFHLPRLGVSLSPISLHEQRNGADGVMAQAKRE